MRLIHLPTVAAAVALALSGCATAPNQPGSGGASGYTPVIDLQGVDMGRYEADLGACRRLAQHGDPNMERLLGAVIVGSLVGAALSPRGYRTDMADYGGRVAGMQQLGGDANRAKAMMINCMAGRGYRTLEVTLPPAMQYAGPSPYQAPLPVAVATPPAPIQAAAPAPTLAPAPVAAYVAPVAPVVGAATAIVRPTEPRIGPDSRIVERLPAVLACNSRPIAVLVGQALASQSNYSVACAGGDTMMVRCEYGTCRVMQ